jgi:transposase-like protein
MAKQHRDPAKEALWRDTFKRFAASGLSVREFCKRENVTESAFYAWRRTIGERDDVGDSGPAFVPAVINGKAEQHEPLALKLASGLELRLPLAISATRLAELVRALERRAER